MTVDIVIPVQADSDKLAKTVALVEQNTADYRLHIVKEPDLNVSEARQKAMNEIVKGDLVCFLDDDAEMVSPGWLPEMLGILEAKPDAGAVFQIERWGTEQYVPAAIEETGEIAYGPAACMLMDRRRLSPKIQWDQKIGLRSGWLGGDFEEVDYCHQIRASGLKLYRTSRSVFNHTGGRTTLEAFSRTDRYRTVCAMQILLDYKYRKAPDDGDWFKGLKYVPADPNNDLNLAPGASLHDCYREVILRNGLGHVPMFRKAGLV